MHFTYLFTLTVSTARVWSVTIHADNITTKKSLNSAHCVLTFKLFFVINNMEVNAVHSATIKTRYVVTLNSSTPFCML